MLKETPKVMWILDRNRGRNTNRLIAPNGLHRAASLAAGSMIAFSATLILPHSVSAQGPPVTDPNSARCADIPENIAEDVFFLNVYTPATAGVGPGSQVGAWYSDETMPNTNPAPTFVLTGPNTHMNLPPGQDPFNQKFNEAHKECRHQVNITTTIPAAAAGGGAYAPGDYKLTLTAFDGDESPDKGTHVWIFTVAAPSPSPSPTSGTSPASSSGSGPASQVQAASTTGPGLPNTGHVAPTSSPPRGIGAAAFASLVGLVVIAISRRIRTAIATT
jgi:hypothetical protein